MLQRETTANQAQADHWNGRGGAVWVEQQEMLDRLLAPIEHLLADVLQDAGSLDVLDIGCGAGATTLAAARRLAGRGRATGIDLSTPMIEAGSRRAEAQGLGNASFIAADARQHEFEPGRFDALISRFGIMFFADPVAAFANLRKAAAPNAALTAVAWRGAEENPFMTTAERAAAPLLPELQPRDPDGPGQFAFADDAKVRRILTASGWAQVDLEPFDMDCTLSQEDLAVFITRMGPVGALLSQADDVRRAAVAAVLQRAFAPYLADGEARFTAACWLIKARNPC